MKRRLPSRTTIVGENGEHIVAEHRRIADRRKGPRRADEIHMNIAIETLIGLALQLDDARRLHRSDAEVDRLHVLLERTAATYRRLLNALS